jgi:hypothetical protein
MNIHEKRAIKNYNRIGVVRALVNPFIRFDPAGDVRPYGPRETEKVLPTLVEGNIQIAAGTTTGTGTATA